jgi:hypothetical protein
MSISVRIGRHRLAAVLILAASVAGCGWFRGGEPMLGKLDDSGVAGALVGTWVCTEIYMVKGLTPGDYEVTFTRGSGQENGGRYTTKPDGMGEWRILEVWQDPSGEYFVKISMKDNQGNPSGVKGRKVVDVEAGQWDLASMTRKSFVRRANGVALKYERKP